MLVDYNKNRLKKYIYNNVLYFNIVLKKNSLLDQLQLVRKKTKKKQFEFIMIPES